MAVREGGGFEGERGEEQGGLGGGEGEEVGGFGGDEAGEGGEGVTGGNVGTRG